MGCCSSTPQTRQILDPVLPAEAAKPEAEAQQESPPPAQQQAPPPEPPQEEITCYEYPHDPPGCNVQLGDHPESEGDASCDKYAQKIWNEYCGPPFGMEEHYGLRPSSK